MPEAAALVCVNRFLASNLANIRNKSGFLVGVLNRFREEGGEKVLEDPSERTVHVGNLVKGVTADVVRQIFNCIGKVLSVRLENQFAFVEFTEKSSAEMALKLDGTDVAGAKIKVTKAIPPPPAAQVIAPSFTALANITSPAAFEALQKQAQQKPSLAQEHHMALLNPAQQRAAIEQRHQTLMTNTSRAWGMSRRRSPDSDRSDSRDRRSPPPRHYPRRGDDYDDRPRHRREEPRSYRENDYRRPRNDDDYYYHHRDRRRSPYKYDDRYDDRYRTVSDDYDDRRSRDYDRRYDRNVVSSDSRRY